MFLYDGCVMKHKHCILQQQGLLDTKRLAIMLFVLLLLCTGALPALAQQTIFNVPSADVTPQGQVFLQHESQFRLWRPGRFWLGTHYAAVGIGHHTELDATLFNISAPASNNSALGLGFKSAIPVLQSALPKQDVRITVGSMVPISFEDQGVGNWSYLHLSGRIPKLKTRLTAGVSVGTRQIFGRNTVGFIAGYEQPVTQRLSLLGDWYSGTHGSGFFIPGISYAFPKAISAYLGFQIPNNTRCGQSGLVFELSKLIK